MHYDLDLKEPPIFNKWVTFTNTHGELVLVNLCSDVNDTEVEIDPREVGFFLFTKHSDNDGTRIHTGDSDTLFEAGFNPTLKTKILVHGFLNNINSPTIQDLKTNFFLTTEKGMNVFGVDWSVYTSSYAHVDKKSKKVGTIIANFIDFIVTKGNASLDDIHCIGHSLGAHACGFAGKSVTGGRISRITGLDPALPGFRVSDPSERLDRTDAEFVDCIHTCSGLLGVDVPICTSDFYPNSGRSQPGCGRKWYDLGSCSHGRSHELFAESILKDHPFPAATCNNLTFKNCVYEGALMGYPATNEFTGIFYTTTQDSYPYSKLH